MDIIQVNNLTQDYGSGRGIFDVSFNVAKGEVFGFLGPNGAGKSTTIRHLMGFSKPQKGNAKIFDMECFDNYYKILDKVGYLPGEIALPDGLTGWEFINMMAKLRKIKNVDRLNLLLKKFDLDPSPETKLMSLGDKRKLAIVTAFMSDPELLILDEPTSGLDPVMQQVFVDYIKEEKSRGKTIFLSSHIFNEVESTCDRIAIIKDGRIVSLFDTTSIKHNENKTFIVKLNNALDFDKLLKTLPRIDKNTTEYAEVSIKDYNKKNLTLMLVVNDKSVGSLVQVLSDVDVKALNEDKLTLENYFMEFYRQDKNIGGDL